MGQLGYAVAHRNTKQRDCIGVWFLIQSPQKSSEYCSGAINKHLLEKREVIKNISDEDFEQQKSAVHTLLAEKDMNLNQENARIWGEICQHTYTFDRQEKSLEILK